MTVTLHFFPDDVQTIATPGEPLLAAAQRANLYIPTGCLTGSCGACEMELNGEDVRSCITAVPEAPANGEPIVIHLFSDPSWS